MWMYKKDETQMRESEGNRPMLEVEKPIFYFLNVFIFRQEPEFESGNQPAGPWSLSSMSVPVTAATAETATSLQQLPTNV